MPDPTRPFYRIRKNRQHGNWTINWWNPMLCRWEGYTGAIADGDDAIRLVKTMMNMDRVLNRGIRMGFTR